MKETIEEYVERRLRAEWPGTHVTEYRGVLEVPEVRAGGATDLLIRIAATIAGEYEG